MKNSILIMTFLLAFMSQLLTAKAQTDIKLDMMVNLYYKCTKDTIYRDSINQIRSNDSKLNQFLTTMSPSDWDIFDSTGFIWYVSLFFDDVQITKDKDTFKNMVKTWVESTNEYYKGQNKGDSCIHYDVGRLYELNYKVHRPNAKVATVKPNPGKNVYTILNTEGTLNIYNTAGQTIQHQDLLEDNTEVQLKAPAGIYYFSIQHINGFIETHKIIHSP